LSDLRLQDLDQLEMAHLQYQKLFFEKA